MQCGLADYKCRGEWQTLDSLNARGIYSDCTPNKVVFKIILHLLANIVPLCSK